VEPGTGGCGSCTLIPIVITACSRFLILVESSCQRSGRGGSNSDADDPPKKFTARSSVVLQQAQTNFSWLPILNSCLEIEEPTATQVASSVEFDKQVNHVNLSTSFHQESLRRSDRANCSYRDRHPSCYHGDWIPLKRASRQYY
jgi:hypothetical protein